MDSTNRGLLTRRQAEVVRLVIEGYANREVAEMLFITPQTVKSHLRQAFRKCQVRNRVGLARWWLTHGEEPHEETRIGAAPPLVESAGPPGKGARKRRAFALAAVLAAVTGLSLFLATDIPPDPHGALPPSSQAALIVCPAGDSTCLLELERACQSWNAMNDPGVYDCLAAPSSPP
jgi:DNA-binding CsgD family transcriptional regulator